MCIYILLSHWRRSLQLFSPHNIKLSFSFFLVNFFKAIKLFLRYFGWLFIIDILLFLFFGEFIFQASRSLNNLAMTNSMQSTNISISTAAIFLHLTVLITWFVLSTGFLLSIRKEETEDGWQYFKEGFFRYIQLAILFSIVIFVTFNLLVSMGIYQFPKLHWTISIFVRLIELLTFFYWLDSKYNLIDVFYSLENALNLVLYNLPFFILLFLFWWLFKFSLSFILAYFYKSFNLSLALSGAHILDQLNTAVNSLDIFSITKALGLKYLLFFFDYFVISFVFTFYCLKKEEKYSSSIF